MEQVWESTIVTSQNQPVAQFEAASDLMERNQYAEALKLYLSLAAKFRSVTAYQNIGWIYQKGLGVEIDLDRATFWFQKASMAGSKEGSFYLANLYSIQRRYTEAEEILQELAGTNVCAGLL